jgi:hypothetical protein
VIKHIYLLLIIFFANDLFYLVDPKFIPGMFRISDFNIIFIFIGILYYLSSKDLNILPNFFSWWILFYLLLVLTQVSIASFKYSQSVVDGLISVRSQFSYLSFFIFLFALDNYKEIERFIDLLTAVAIILIIISLINYFGPAIYQHRLSEGHGVRSGITRAFIPGDHILVFTAIWHFFKHVNTEKIVSFSLFLFIILLGGLVFRQTRANLIAIFMVLFIMLIERRKFKLFIGLGISVLLLIGFTSIILHENILFDLLGSAYTELAGTEGKWGARVEQFEGSWYVFAENFLTGSGGLAIRHGWLEFRDESWAADLGYWVWLKFYGVPGIILLVLLIVVFTRKSLDAMRKLPPGKEYDLVYFSFYYFIAILISLVTLTYLTNESRIVMLCLNWAILANLSQDITRSSGFTQFAENR